MSELQTGRESGEGWLGRVLVGVLVVVLVAGGAWLLRELAAKSDQKKAEIEKAALYDVSALLKVDPGLIRYREASQFATNLKKPTLLALSNDEILVGGDRSIVRFDRTGQRLGEFALPAEPTALAVDIANKNIYVGLTDHVAIYKTEGVLRGRWKSLGERAYIAGIAPWGTGAFIADGGQRQVVYMPYGVMNATPKDFLIPDPRHMDIACVKRNQFWVADTGRHQIKAFGEVGNMQQFWGEGGVKLEQFTGCCNPADFCILPDGSFITAEKGLPRVKKYSADGKFECVVLAAEKAEDTAEGLDVAADAGGRIFLLDRTKKVVRIMVAKEGR